MKTIEIEKLLRLTLTRKGRAVAKHPYLREGVVEAVKAREAGDPLWEVPELEDGDWYGDFAQFIAECPEEDIPEDWTEAFDTIAVKSQKKNYPDSRGPFAGPHNSFPIKSQQDVYDAARLIGHAKNRESVKERIIRIARSRGFSLPKSWQKKVTKSMDEEQLIEALKAALEPLIQRVTFTPEAPAAPAAEPEAPAATPAAETPVVEAPAAEEVEETEKAKAQSHDHSHSHVSTYGYSYMHSHMHGDAEHMNDEQHDQSETAHAHEHTAKSLDPETEADLKGLSADLATVKAQLVEKDRELVEAQKALVVSAAKVDELEKAAARPPLTAAPIRETQKSRPDITQMSFDQAFDAVLHS